MEWITQSYFEEKLATMEKRGNMEKQNKTKKNTLTRLKRTFKAHLICTLRYRKKHTSVIGDYGVHFTFK